MKDMKKIDNLCVLPLTEKIFACQIVGNIPDIPMKSIATFYSEIGQRLREASNNIVTLTNQLSSLPMTPGLFDLVSGLRYSNLDLVSALNDYSDFTEVLDVTKKDRAVGSGREKVHSRQTIMLEETLSKSLEIAQSKPYSGDDISFSLRVDTSIPLYIRVDESRFQQILVILLTETARCITENSPDPHVTLVVQSDSAVDNIAMTTFTITSTSLPRSKKPLIISHRICEGPDDSASVILCRRLIELMRGKLSVIRRCTNDITFLMEIPLVVVNIDLHRSGESVSGEVPKFTGREKSVLIYDDVLSDRLVLCDILYSLNLKPITASTMEEFTMHLTRGGNSDIVIGRAIKCDDDVCCDNMIEVLGVGEASSKKLYLTKPYIKSRVQEVCAKALAACQDDEDEERLNIILVGLSSVQADFVNKALLRCQVDLSTVKSIGLDRMKGNVHAGDVVIFSDANSKVVKACKKLKNVRCLVFEPVKDLDMKYFQGMLNMSIGEIEKVLRRVL